MRSTLPRRILGAVLLAMAAGQLSDLSGFVAVLETYRAIPAGGQWALALALVAAELGAGAGLLVPAGRVPRAGALLALGVAGVWTGLAVQAFGRGLALDNCGCFGVHLAQPLRWWVLAQDAVFLASAGWAVHTTRGSREIVTPAPALSGSEAG